METNINDRFTNGAIAQLVERQIEDLGVVGSIPTRPTKIVERVGMFVGEFLLQGNCGEFDSHLIHQRALSWR